MLIENWIKDSSLLFDKVAADIISYYETSKPASPSKDLTMLQLTEQLQHALYAAMPSLKDSAETLSASNSYATSAADYVQSGYADTNLVRLVDQLRSNFASVSRGDHPTWGLDSVRDRLLISQHCAEFVKKTELLQSATLAEPSTRLSSNPSKDKFKTGIEQF